MASQCTRARAIAAGLTCGAGVVVPAAAFIATIPFEEAHAVVSACALPFAAGALAGAGVNVLVGHMAMRGSEQTAAAEAESHDYAATSTSLFGEADEADVERFFGGRRAPKGVPVIARAQGAPSEAEAWAEIDSMLDESSPISCDPRYSKDIYEIAFEELKRESERAESAAAAPASEPAADSTAVFMALAGVASEPESAQTSEIAADDAYDTDSARLAAIASLDSIDGEELASKRISRDPIEVMHHEEPETVPTVEMADYSGHEDMWASALAILAEETTPEAESTDSVYMGKHMRPAAALTQPTAVPPSPERAAAVNEGALATERHMHVNELIEDEFDHVPSKSVRRTSREYLSVIQGGTASLPRLRAEA